MSLDFFILFLLFLDLACLCFDLEEPLPLCVEEEGALTKPRTRADRSESDPEELLDDSEELEESEELETAERLRERLRGEAERLRGDAER